MKDKVFMADEAKANVDRVHLPGTRWTILTLDFRRGDGALGARGWSYLLAYIAAPGALVGLPVALLGWGLGVFGQSLAAPVRFVGSLLVVVGALSYVWVLSKPRWHLRVGAVQCDPDGSTSRLVYVASADRFVIPFDAGVLAAPGLISSEQVFWMESRQAFAATSGHGGNTQH